MKNQISINRLAAIKNMACNLVLCAVLLCSCGEATKKETPQKPFIIKFKYPNSSLAADGYCRYQYYDGKGNTFEFYDGNEKYSVGDTIK